MSQGGSREPAAAPRGSPGDSREVREVSGRKVSEDPAGPSGAEAASGSARPVGTERGRKGLSRLWPLLILLAVQAAYLLLVTEFSGTWQPPAELQPLGGVAIPGGSATLGLRILDRRTWLFRHSLAGARVTLYRIDSPSVPPDPDPESASPPAAGLESVGEVVTTPDGTAAITVQAPTVPGLTSYRASVVPGPGTPPLVANVVEVQLQVVARGAPLVLACLPEAVQLLDGHRSPGAEAEAKALAELAPRASIAYLLARPLASGSDAERLLQSITLPPGTVLAAPEALQGKGKMFLARELGGLDFSLFKPALILAPPPQLLHVDPGLQDVATWAEALRRVQEGR